MSQAQSSEANSADQLQRFSFDNTDIRGEITHLNASYREVMKRHQYPKVIAVELGELMAATALLSASLKFAGRLTLQVRLPGNVSLLQAETSDKGELRAIARYDAGLAEEQLTFDNGQLVITIEPEQGQKYQGITAIEGGNIAAAMEEYFEQSEQLASRFWLECDGDNAAGFMLQKMPAMESSDADAWNRLTQLADTLKPEELLLLNNEVLLHRLYHDEAIRIYPPSELKFFCTCSKTRLATALTQLGYDELDDILKQSGKIDVSCEFCQQHYSFDRPQVDALFPQRNPH